MEIGTSAEELEKLLRSKLLDELDKVEVTSIKYKIQEYQALSGEIVSPEAGWGILYVSRLIFQNMEYHMLWLFH